MQTASPQPSRLRLVAVCFALTVAGLVLGTVVALGLFLLVFVPAGIELTATGELVLSLVSLQGIAFPAVAILYFRSRDRSLRAFVPVALPDRRQVAIVVVAWLGTLLLIGVGGSIISSLLGSEPATNTAGQTALENPGFIPYLIPLVFLLNAPGEELLFRGVIQGLLRERFGAPAAILLATATFAPMHIFALVGGPRAALVTIVTLSIPSIVFGTVYEVTDNLVVPTLVHALFNATLFAGLYLAATAG